MLLVHDVIEIEAGDTFCYNTKAHMDKAAREQLAAARTFGLLPDDLGVKLRELWDEFEAGGTAEARFANALDRLQLLLHNFHTQGGTWREHSITRAQVLARMALIEHGSPSLWPFALGVIDEA